MIFVYSTAFCCLFVLAFYLSILCRVWGIPNIWFIAFVLDILKINTKQHFYTILTTEIDAKLFKWLIQWSSYEIS